MGSWEHFDSAGRSLPRFYGFLMKFLHVCERDPIALNLLLTDALCQFG